MSIPQINKFNLFATSIYEFPIDAISYNKSQIIKDVEHNYNLEPNRNKWDNYSNLHHLYADWNNEKFIDLSIKNKNINDLINIYDVIIKNFLSINSFTKNYEFGYKLVNITALKKDQFMNAHTHIDPPDENGFKTIFTCVHYIKTNEINSFIDLYNPLIFSYDKSMMGNIDDYFDSKDIKNSCYFSNFRFPVKQDYFYIFPAYLKHSIPVNEIDDLRISAVINITIKS